MTDPKNTTKTGKSVNGWEIGARIGEGGNGIVYAARRAGTNAAIKFLNARADDRRFQRFHDEIEAMRQCGGVPGILPLLDDSLAATGCDAEPPWFVMPIATPFHRWKDDLETLERVVERCLAVAKILETLHARNMSHRDVKPTNILLHDGQWCLGDLGLADYPGKLEITESGERIGPRDYMAPEMANAKAISDARPADVYSLAKVLWTLAAKQSRPLPGWQSAYEEASRLSAIALPPHPRARLLDPLIDWSTRNSVAERPCIVEFARELKRWLSPMPPVTVVSDGSFKAAAEVIQASRRARQEADEFARERGARLAQDRERQAEFEAATVAQVRARIATINIGFSEILKEVFGYAGNDFMGVNASTPVGSANANFTLHNKLDFDPRTQIARLTASCSVIMDGHHFKGTRRGLISEAEWREAYEFRAGSAEEDCALERYSKGGREALCHGIDVIVRLITSDPK